MELFVSIMVFVIGLCLGSFVNMLVYRTAGRYGLMKKKRLPRHPPLRVPRNDVMGRSFCDFCGKQLSWYENIPVVSWLVLGGRTKCCHKRLPLTYPVVEITTGLLFLIYNLQFTNYGQQTIFNSQFLFGLVIITLLVFSTVFDAKYMILPDFSTYILIGIALTMIVFYGGNFLTYVLAALGAGGFLLFLHILTKGRGMGIGDVKLAVFMGLLLGWPGVMIAFYTAFISGALVGGTMMVARKLKRNALISFGPFLILGTIVAWWWGEAIVKLVIGYF
jgi:prepilin signal peptidase PulO-like enzyme (type II secretory pathway)